MIKKPIVWTMLFIVGVGTYFCSTYLANRSHKEVYMDYTLSSLYSDIVLLEKLRAAKVSSDILELSEQNVERKLLMFLTYDLNPKYLRGQAANGMCKALELNSKGVLFQTSEAEIVLEGLTRLEESFKKELYSEYNYTDGADCDF